MTWKAGALEDLADLVKWNPPTWVNQSACKSPEYKTIWWFMVGSNRRSVLLTRRAKSICVNSCPVRWRCLAEYIDQPFGIFGGLDEDQRRALYKTTTPRSRHNPDFLRAKLSRKSDHRGGVNVEIRVS